MIYIVKYKSTPLYKNVFVPYEDNNETISYGGVEMENSRSITSGGRWKSIPTGEYNTTCTATLVVQEALNSLRNEAIDKYSTLTAAKRAMLNFSEEMGLSEEEEESCFESLDLVVSRYLPLEKVAGELLIEEECIDHCYMVDYSPRNQFVALGSNELLTLRIFLFYNKKRIGWEKSDLSIYKDEGDDDPRLWVIKDLEALLAR